MNPGQVTVAYCYGNIDPDFHHSLLRLKDYDARAGHGRLSHAGWLVAVGTTNIASGRNKAVKAFLDTESEWLWFIDTDQVFDHDVIDRMVESAGTDIKVLSALIMARREQHAPLSPACALMHPESLQIVRPTAIPDAQHWPVAVAGTGCLLIHREVLVKMGEAHTETPSPWFAYSPWKREEDGKTVWDEMGEDYTFSLRAVNLGYQPVVDTTIEVGHNKTTTLWRAHFDAQHGPRKLPDPKVFVVIPMKDRKDMTRNLLTQLSEQGIESDQIVLVDNGSGSDTRRWLESQRWADTVIDAAGAGIHEMWNAGANYALANHPNPYILFLNNDISIGPDFCTALMSALDSDPSLVAVCPNYDGRSFLNSEEFLEDETEVEQLHGICADRYDGTGGLAGFAFMVKGLWFTKYQFPEDCKWWFGDNDLTISIDMAGGWYGMCHATTVEHLDGGGVTAKDAGGWDSPEMQEQLAKDRAAFQAKWSA